MKAVHILLAAAILAAQAAPAAAAVREFGPEPLRYTLDVPETWQVSEQAQGHRLQLSVPGAETAVTIAIGTLEGRDAGALVRRITRDLSGNATRRVDSVTWSFDIVSENVRVRNQLRVFGAYYMVVTMGGAEETIAPVLASLQLVTP